MGYNSKQLKTNPLNKIISKPYGKDVIYTKRGQWDYPGQITKIPSSKITMDGVNYPVQGVDDTGYSQMMYPGMDYTFPGQYVTEYPMARYGGGTDLPIIEDAGSFNQENIWVPDWKTMTDQAKKLGSKTVKTKSGVIINFDKNWQVKSADDNPIKRYGGDPSLANIEGHYPFGGIHTKTDTHMATGGWLDTMQKGGRTPIVVDDKNNSRLKAYNDSLALYNLSQKAKKLFDVDPSNDVLQGYNKKANDLASKSKIKPTKLQLSGYNQDYPKNFDPGTMEEPWMVTYKKPVQPYIYKKPEEKEQSRTDVYTDKALFDKAYKAEQDSAKLYEGYIKNIEGKKKIRFEPPHMTPMMVETGKMKNGLPIMKEVLQSNISGYEKDKIQPIGIQWVNDRDTEIIGYHADGTPVGGNSHESGYTKYKKPVVHNVYQPPPPEEEKEPIKDTIPYKPKPKSIKSDTTRQWNFNGINPIMEYFDGSHKIIGKDYYKDMNAFKKGKKTKPLTKQNGGLLKNEYKRGGQKGLKKYTSKNIATSVNDIFTRNETLFGPAGKKRYKPGLKYKSGGGWLDNLT